jgi:hypothetical protein
VRRTAPGTGVTVQSASEIQEMKRLRKEQKKAIRSQKGDRDENEVSADILGFETENWKAAREEALSNASQRPLFSSPHKVRYRRKGNKHEMAFDVEFSQSSRSQSKQSTLMYTSLEKVETRCPRSEHDMPFQWAQ